MLTTGCSWCSTATTCRPFGSVRISYGGKLHVARGQRPRRALGRPGRILGRQPAERPRTRRHSDQRERRHRAPSSPHRPRRRHDRQHQPVLRREVGARHALHCRRRDVLEDVELAVGGRDVVVDDRGVRQVQRLLLVRLAAEDVVARELVLRPLQLAVGDRLALQPLELGDERVDGLLGLAGPAARWRRRRTGSDARSGWRRRTRRPRAAVRRPASGRSASSGRRTAPSTAMCSGYESGWPS